MDPMEVRWIPRYSASAGKCLRSRPDSRSWLTDDETPSGSCVIEERRDRYREQKRVIYPNGSWLRRLVVDFLARLGTRMFASNG